MAFDRRWVVPDSLGVDRGASADTGGQDLSAARDVRLCVPVGEYAEGGGRYLVLNVSAILMREASESAFILCITWPR